MQNNVINTPAGYLGLNIHQVKELCKLLAILSKFEALTIFLLAKNGLKAETDTPGKIGLTRKQYFTRLKQLVDSGLIEKRDGSYFHTTMGAFVYEKHLVSLLEGVKNAKEMRMIDVLKQANNFSEDDILQLKDTVLRLKH